MALESFFLMGAKPLVEDTPTWKLHQLIDWEAVFRKLKGLYRREESHGCGPEPAAAQVLLRLGGVNIGCNLLKSHTTESSFPEDVHEMGDTSSDLPIGQHAPRVVDVLAMDRAGGCANHNPRQQLFAVIAKCTLYIRAFNGCATQGFGTIALQVQAVEKVHQTRTDAQPLLMHWNIRHVGPQRADQCKQCRAVASPHPCPFHLCKALPSLRCVSCKQLSQMFALVIADLHKPKWLKIAMIWRPQCHASRLEQFLSRRCWLNQVLWSYRKTPPEEVERQLDRGRVLLIAVIDQRLRFRT